MAEKVSTLVLEVDLECERCYKKIKEVSCKLPAKENISSIYFDSKNSKVTISGPFDPSKLSRKLRCKACNCNIIIKPKSDDNKDGDKNNNTKVKAAPKAEAASASTTTVNLQFSQVCNICYPWPCSDPSHCELRPQHCAFPPMWSCAGPSHCGGCGSCQGDGGGGGARWWPRMPPPVYCRGASCSGCKGCRLVLENKFSYEEYPPSACAIM